MDQNKAAAEARRRQATIARPIREELLRNYREQGDRTDYTRRADVTGWWPRTWDWASSRSGRTMVLQRTASPGDPEPPRRTTATGT
jgi:hypothetical protein